MLVRLDLTARLGALILAIATRRLNNTLLIALVAAGISSGQQLRSQPSIRIVPPEQVSRTEQAYRTEQVGQTHSDSAVVLTPPQLGLVPSSQNVLKVRVAESTEVGNSPIGVAAGRPSIGAEATRKNETRTSAPVPKPISQISIDIQPKSSGDNRELPPQQPLRELDQSPIVAYTGAVANPYAPTPVQHTAANFAYRPLYFQQENLERYGNHCGVLQPVVSAARFYGTFPALPYLASQRPPCTPYYWYWPYETGRPAPRFLRLPPLELKPAAVQSAAIAGAILLVP